MSQGKVLPIPGSAGKWIPDGPAPVPLTTMVAMHGTDDERIRSILGPNGILSTGERFTYRPAQHQLAQFGLRALNQRKHLLAEAGTGTGKSFGLLVPLIEYAMRTGTIAVVSTAQNVLLDQYKNKDLPFLHGALRESLQEKYGRNFRWATMKGRSNYYCPMSRHENDTDQYTEQVNQVWEWLERTTTGDLSELPFDVNRYLPLKQALVSESDECPGSKKCEAGENCFYYAAKNAAAEVDILVVNHSLLACDLVSGGQILPTWEAFAIDEGHQFQKYVASAMEFVVKQGRWTRLIGKLKKFQQDVTELWVQISIWTGALGNLAEKLEDGGKLDLKGQRVPKEFFEANEAIQIQLHRMAVDLEIRPESQALPLSRAVNELRINLSLIDFDSNKSSSWIEKDNKGHVGLHIVPVDCSDFLSENFWKKHPGIIASATLATSGESGKEFNYVKSDLGVPGHPYELVLPSPFDWPKQALYVYPAKGFLSDSDFKAHRGESYRSCVTRWVNKAWPLVKRAMQRTQGRAFVLCTSRMACDIFWECHLSEKLPYPCRRQGDASKAALIDWFKSESNPVLYATSSFWEGVDIPGNQLQLVVIDKIPFPNTSDPLEKARSDRFGREAFDRYQVPLAVTHLKQGVGRLIRTEHDRGILLLLDPRFLEKGYGKTIAAALPGEALVAMKRQVTNITAFLAGYSPECIDKDLDVVITPNGGRPPELYSDYMRLYWGSNDPVETQFIQQLSDVGALTLLQWQQVEYLNNLGNEVPF